MSSAIRAGRSVAAAIIGAGALLAGTAAVAAANPAPGCSAADVTNVEAEVATGLTGYLFGHPDVNNFFSGLQGLSNDDAFSQVKGYLSANPGIKADIDAIRAPAKDLRARCNIPVSGIIRSVL